MRQKSILILFIFLLSLTALGQKLEKKLSQLAKTYNFTYEALSVNTNFEEKYLIWFEQPVDHGSPEAGTFTQRVFLSHKDFDAPVVFVTEGYAAHYGAKKDYQNELSELFGTNQIVVEHRYFGSSVPEPLNWEYLTVAHAAADQHRVIEALREVYDGKWISTGISKGGQTTMYHRYFYPDDVEISVPYVAPLNFSTEEQRVYRFLETVGTAECREKILNFQTELLKQKKRFLKEFKKMAEQRKLTYSMGVEKAYELVVLEYSFAFWQWGKYTCDKIPEDLSDTKSIIRHLDAVAGIDWISNESISGLQPFFYQAMREIGFYGYDIEPFREWVSYDSNPTFEFTLPEGVSVEFEPELMQKVDFFIRHQGENMLFIYGEVDPWSAPAAQLTYQTNSVKVVKQGGSHTTRIKNLPEDQKEFVIQTLNSWLAE